VLRRVASAAGVTIAAAASLCAACLREQFSSLKWNSKRIILKPVMTDVPLLNGLIFAVLGILIFVVAFSLLVRLAPLDLWKEIRQERNIAAAILAGAVALGICWIIAATMH
jgi:hypothetical protein